MQIIAYIIKSHLYHKRGKRNNKLLAFFIFLTFVPHQKKKKPNPKFSSC